LQSDLKIGYSACVTNSCFGEKPGGKYEMVLNKKQIIDEMGLVTGLVIGVGLGIIFGIIYGSISLGIAFGAAFGLTFGGAFTVKRKAKQSMRE
jgi:hypothetical protein